jgi:hypothetical protein
MLTCACPSLSTLMGPNCGTDCGTVFMSKARKWDAGAEQAAGGKSAGQRIVIHLNGRRYRVDL